MTQEQQRIAIAEACGWAVEECRDAEGFINVASLPNYLNDLNAMHEVEGTLSQAEQEDYIHFLMEAVVPKGKPWGWYVINATASQRAEAFLKVKGLWIV